MLYTSSPSSILSRKSEKKEMKLLPQSRLVNTGDEHKVQPTIDDFFAETAEYIRAKYPRVGPEELFIDSGEISYSWGAIPTDRITHLKYKERVVACVLETRMQFNYVQYDFFRNVKWL